MAFNPLKSSSLARQLAADCHPPVGPDGEPTMTYQEFEAIKAEALAVIDDIQYNQLPLSSSLIASLAFSVLYKIPTTAVPTMGVMIGADGTYLFLYNPIFTVKLKETVHGPLVVVWHEFGGHVFNLDCWRSIDEYLDPDWEMARESRINWLATKKVLHVPMPEIDGKVTGVDPDEVLKAVNKDRKKKSLAPVDDDTMYATLQSTYDYIHAIDKPPTITLQFCTHDSGEGSPESGDGSPKSGDDESSNGPKIPIDKEEADKLRRKILEEAVRAVVDNGHERGKQELLTLMDVTAGDPELSKLWGDVGADRLRGVPVGTQKTSLWKTWTMNALASRLQDGSRWMYHKKIGAAALALRLDTPLRPRGKEELKTGSVFVDVSGSMSRDVIDALAPLMSEVPNLDITYYDFDCYVAPVGERLRDGGGTNFSCIEETVTNLDEEPDFVLVITDGDAPEITPSFPEKWIWLIVPGGDNWPDAAGMTTRQLELSDIGL